MPSMWERFKSLFQVPAIPVRRKLGISYLLQPSDMQARHPALTSVVLRNEGHAPLLLDRLSQRLISDFLAQTDKTWMASPPLPPLHNEIQEV